MGECCRRANPSPIRAFGRRPSVDTCSVSCSVLAIRLVSSFNADARELVEMLVGLASRAGWKGAARATKEGDDYVIALRVRRRPLELSEREWKRRARSERE